jgi:two-component system, sensor histidine kinase
MSLSLPPPVRAYLDQVLFSDRHLFCALFGVDGQIAQTFGNASRFGISESGAEVRDLVLGAGDGTLVIPAIQFGAGLPAHLHSAHFQGQHFVLLLSADSNYSEIGAQQQLANELALANSRQAQTIAALTQAQELLRQSERELKRAHDLKSMFIGKMSHEFGTPITAALGRMRLLESEIGESQHAAQQHLAVVRRGVLHLHQLVQSVLDEARLEQGTLRLEPGRVQMSNLLDDIVQLFSPAAEEKGLSLQVSLEDDKLLWIDGLRVKQILINLVSNGLKYTNAGRVTLYMHWRDGKLTASVTDTGPGMTAEQAASLFRPFKRLAEHANVSGTGLGLVISRELAQHMGGSIEARSTLGEGSSFILVIPCDVADAQQSPQKRGLKVLVVDDDEDIRELLGALLLREEMIVSSAVDGAQAELRFREMQPDVILLDMQLGTEHGYEVAKKLRKLGCVSRIVALSASNSGETSALALGGGCDAFLSKPVDFERLKELIQEHEWTR